MDDPSGLEEALLDFAHKMQQEKINVATRKSSEMVINVLGPLMPELVGGSADLTGSNNTNWSGTVAITKDNFSGKLFKLRGERICYDRNYEWNGFAWRNKALQWNLLNFLRLC